MRKRCTVRNTVKEERGLVRKNELVGTLTDRQQLILHIIGQNVLTICNAGEIHESRMMRFTNCDILTFR